MDWHIAHNFPAGRGERVSLNLNLVSDPAAQWAGDCRQHAGLFGG